jgi:hypothetical protein
MQARFGTSDRLLVIVLGSIALLSTAVLTSLPAVH